MKNSAIAFILGCILVWQGEKALTHLVWGLIAIGAFLGGYYIS